MSYYTECTDGNEDLFSLDVPEWFEGEPEEWEDFVQTQREEDAEMASVWEEDAYEDYDVSYPF